MADAKALVLWGRLPNLRLQPPPHDVARSDALEILSTWGKFIGNFAQASERKQKAITERPERRYWGISLMQLPVCDLEHDEMLVQPRGHDHYVGYVHWDKVSENVGRPIHLEDEYIKYTQPIRKRTIDMRAP